MPTRFFPLPPSAFKDAFLRSLAMKIKLRNETLRIRLSPTLPLTGEEINATEKHPFLKDGHLTIDVFTKARRQAFKGIPLDHPNVRLPFTTSHHHHRSR